MSDIDMDMDVDETPTVPQNQSKWHWIGAPDRPESAKHSDGISDLFDVDSEADTDDLVNVDIEKDVMDSDDDGSLDSLVTVTEEDIMGDDVGQTPMQSQQPLIRRISPMPIRRPFYPRNDSGLAGMR